MEDFINKQQINQHNTFNILNNQHKNKKTDGFGN